MLIWGGHSEENFYVYQIVNFLHFRNAHDNSSGNSLNSYLGSSQPSFSAPHQPKLVLHPRLWTPPPPPHSTVIAVSLFYRFIHNHLLSKEQFCIAKSTSFSITVFSVTLLILVMFTPPVPSVVLTRPIAHLHLWNTSCDLPPSLLHSLHPLCTVYGYHHPTLPRQLPIFSSFHGHFALSEIFLLVLGSCTPTSFPLMRIALRFLSAESLDTPQNKQFQARFQWSL